MRRVLAVVPDLFFAARIVATAKAAGVEVELCALAAAAARCAASPPALVLLDLHAPGEPPELVRALKADPRTAGVPVVGFYSHVDDARRVAALAAGADAALPRSAFTARLAGLLSGAIPAAPGREAAP
ncbi:MAG TPA: hypothetical protein VGU27_04575 [Candidatus Eisenbacteria bacterium]|nr:hypothetical protein [Candidatus Eisenbacteria bacterium]